MASGPADRGIRQPNHPFAAVPSGRKEGYLVGATGLLAKGCRRFVTRQRLPGTTTERF
jgi:hypothetical protein